MKPDDAHLVKTIKEDQQKEAANPPKPVVIPDFSFDKNAVLYMTYLLFKCNLIARNNLAQLLAEMQKPVPENVTEWLVKESMK